MGTFRGRRYIIHSTVCCLRLQLFELEYHLLSSAQYKQTNKQSRGRERSRLIFIGSAQGSVTPSDVKHAESVNAGPLGDMHNEALSVEVVLNVDTFIAVYHLHLLPELGSGL